MSSLVYKVNELITKSIKWTSSSIHKSGQVYVKSIEWMSSSVHKLDKCITKFIKWMSSLVHKSVRVYAKSTKWMSSSVHKLDKFITKAAFELGENQFQKSFSGKSMCLAVTENTIFRKMISGWPLISPLTRKSFTPLIFTSNYFRREREREKREPRSERERDDRASPRRWVAWSTIAPLVQWS